MVVNTILEREIAIENNIINQKKIRQILERTFFVISEHLISNHKVKINNFGVFKIVNNSRIVFIPDKTLLKRIKKSNNCQIVENQKIATVFSVESGKKEMLTKRQIYTRGS